MNSNDEAKPSYRSAEFVATALEHLHGKEWREIGTGFPRDRIRAVCRVADITADTITLDTAPKAKRLAPRWLVPGIKRRRGK